jgi:hypothetical protein
MGGYTMKKNLTVIFSLAIIFGFAGASTAGVLPYGIGDVTDFLNDGTYFNGYTEITDPFDFSSNWGYTAVAFESGNINYVSESPGGTQTFTTADTTNFELMNYVNFDTHNLYFSDGNPADVPLDAFNPADQVFRLFQLTADSNPFSYLPSNPVFDAGTYFIGFNDNGFPSDFDSDFDDIIVAAKPVPEPATILLLGSGLAGLVGLGRKKFFKK